jgi:hypothetical protein
VLNEVSEPAGNSTKEAAAGPDNLIRRVLGILLLRYGLGSGLPNIYAEQEK